MKAHPPLALLMSLGVSALAHTQVAESPFIPFEAAATSRAVVVLDLRGGEATADAARALTVVVTAEVAATSGYRAVSRNDLRSLLDHQGSAQLLGCAEVSCMADIARLAAADLLVAGSVERIEDALVFSLELIDPTVPKVVRRANASWADDADRVVELARPLVDRLLAGPEVTRFEGGLEVFAPEGSTVIVDGREVGKAPLGRPIHPLESGAHRLEVLKEGHVPYRGGVAVLRNETSLARVDLVSEESLRPWYGRWWVWGSVGGGLALVGGTAAAIAAYAVLNTPTPTTIDVSTELPVD